LVNLVVKLVNHRSAKAQEKASFSRIKNPKPRLEVESKNHSRKSENEDTEHFVFACTTTRIAKY